MDLRSHPAPALRTGSAARELRTLQIDGAGEPLVEHLQARAAALAGRLLQYGSLLMRGFGPVSAADFRLALASIIGEFFDSAGEHVPVKGAVRIFNPVRYAPARRLLWHNENSFNTRWPEIIAFACVRPADEGGESVLADSRTVLRRLHPDVVAEFKARRVQYVRRMGNGMGRHWTDILGVSSREQAERRCVEQGLAFRWLGEMLETSSVRDATLRHPLSAAECWFNQLPHWHQRCLHAEDRAQLLALLGKERMPRDCRFGDGGEIPDDVVDHILETYAANEWAIACQTGDVLILDNVSVAHGRNAFTGQREMLVAMGRRSAA